MSRDYRKAFEELAADVESEWIWEQLYKFLINIK